MTLEQKVAKSLIKNFGVESAIMQTQDTLDMAMKQDSIKDIKEQNFWREVLVEIMRERSS